MSRLKQKYLERVRGELQKRLGYENIMQVPKLERVVVNIGVGDAISNPKLLEVGAEELGIITGQRAVLRRAKKSISNFKLRAGMAIGASVTLRGRRMYEFFDRLVNVAIPRIRDFRGLPKKSFDGRGNYTLGLEEQIIFPEIDYDKVQKIRGMNVTIVTTAQTDREAYELLKELGMPFRER
ncbi:MAG: 50S ribosomal protein L5 [Candidatus Zixiibacteriota bacterium]